MIAKNLLVQAPPRSPTGVKKLGADLRTARLRGNGPSMRSPPRSALAGALSRMVRKVTTQVAVYSGLPQTLSLVDRLDEVADPTLDQEGHRLALTRDRIHARHQKGLDNFS